MVFSRRAYSQTGLSLLLAILLTSQPAHSLPFFGKKKPAESIPPHTRITPNTLQPATEQRLQEAPLPEGAPAPSEETPAPTQETGEKTPPPPPNPLQQLVDKGIFPSDALTRSTPVTRAEFAGILVKALNHKGNLLSEFPFYRDVPRDHWAYAPIEVAREKRLMSYPNDHGFYHPDQPVIYQEVYVAMSNAVTGPPPRTEEIEHILSGFKNWQDLPGDLQPAVAKLARARIFGNRTELLRPQDPATAEGLAPLVIYLMHLVEHRAPLVEETEASIIPVLPEGLGLTLTPNAAIYEAQLSAGDNLNFSLVFPVDPLPKGTRVSGTVRAVTEAHTYAIELHEAVTPEGQRYQTRAELTLFFNPKEKLAFVVPGETFSTTTQAPSNAPSQPLQFPGTTAPAPAKPNTIPPFSPPKTPPSKK